MSYDLSGIVEYHQWLQDIDPRVSKILIDLDDENTTGRVGSRQRFIGDLELRLLLVAKDGKDFVEMMKIALNNRDSSEVEQYARIIWNVALNFTTIKIKEYGTLLGTKQSR